MPTHEMDDDWRDRISAYALGSQSAEETLEFELHLKTPCAACITEVAAARALLARVGLSAKPVAPPARVFDKLMASVRGEPVQTWKRWPATFSSDTDKVTLRADQNAFEPTSIPGIEARRLFVDAKRDVITMLVRMAPGTAYPPHRHGNVEECYVLSGDLQVGDETSLAAGDYQRMEKDSTHPTQWTKRGCTLLLLSSRHDELIDG